MAYLIYEEERRALATGDTVVGSGAQADWRLAHADLAARHFFVGVEPDGSAIVCPGSGHNIVVLNGKQVPSTGASLANGDTIAAGSAFFTFVAEAGAALPRARPSLGAAHLINELERKAYALAKRTVTIGRDAASIVHLRDPSVSRFHADVRAEAGEYVLYSMGSAGTRINGHRVSTPQVLQEGDRLTIGDTELRFSRGPLPPGTDVTEGASEVDVAQARRPTTTLGTIEDLTAIPASRRTSPMLVTVLVVAALVGAWLVFGR
jgi:pSer/pThr/pTyr-binding forkhead associated (FHA) protein